MRYFHGTRPVEAQLFTWSGRVGAAEMSDFGPEGLPLHQVWPDSADEGFTIAGSAGQLRTFVAAGTITRDGEIVAWVFREIMRSGHMDKGPNGLTIKIFND